MSKHIRSGKAVVIRTQAQPRARATQVTIQVPNKSQAEVAAEWRDQWSSGRVTTDKDLVPCFGGDEVRS